MHEEIENAAMFVQFYTYILNINDERTTTDEVH